MSKAGDSMEALLASLQERAKELDCLYRVSDILAQEDVPRREICDAIVAAIPPGWQYPDICWARLELDGVSYGSVDVDETPWKHQGAFHHPVPRFHAPTPSQCLQ